MRHSFDFLLCLLGVYNSRTTCKETRPLTQTVSLGCLWPNGPHLMLPYFGSQGLESLYKLSVEVRWIMQTSCNLASDYLKLTCLQYMLLYIRTSYFWPSLIALTFLHNLSLNCSEAVLIFKSTHKNNNSKK